MYRELLLNDLQRNTNEKILQDTASYDLFEL